MKSTTKKYPGALPMVYAAVERDRNGKPVRTSRDHCPRPLSRKKLRQLMWRRKEEFSANRLSVHYNRKPGPGRTRLGMMQQLDAMEREARKHGEEKLQDVARTMLSKLRGMFGQRTETARRTAPRKG